MRRILHFLHVVGWLAFIVLVFLAVHAEGAEKGKQVSLQPTGYRFDIVPVTGRVALSDINDRGDISATVTNTDGLNDGMLIDSSFNSTLVKCDNLSGSDESLRSINKNGSVSGECVFGEPGARLHRGFVRDKHGRFTFFGPPPNAEGLTAVAGINDQEHVVGQYADPLPVGQSGFTRLNGFMWDQGKFTTINFPLPNSVTTLTGINNRGQIVGWYFTWDGTPNNTGVSKFSGFLYDNGQFTPIDFPDASGTVPLDINNDGQVLGQANAPFVYDDGTFWTLGNPEPSTPGAIVGNLTVAGFNDAGQIVGQYTETVGFKSQVFRFIATPEFAPAPKVKVVKDKKR